MGNWNSGRRPQSTKLKMLRGNPGGRRLNKAEPQPPLPGDAFDTPPALIADDPIAAAEWARLAPMLRGCGLVTEAERSSLLALCQQWSVYLAAYAEVRASGLFTTGTGRRASRMNKALAIADKALVQCRHLWNELGLTPSSRTRMTARGAVEAPPSKWAGVL